MTRDGLTEENLRDGSVKDISHRSRGRPENKEEFVPERERKKAENEDSKSGKGKRLQMEKVRKSSVRQEAVEDTVEVTPEEKVSGYRKKLHRYEKIPDDDNNLNSQKKSIRKKQLQKQMTKEQAKAGRLSFDDEGNDPSGKSQERNLLTEDGERCWYETGRDSREIHCHTSCYIWHESSLFRRGRNR